jgi:hypothetical protein
LTDLLGLWGPQTRWSKATTATKAVTGCDSDEKGCQDGVRPRPLTHRKFDSTRGYPGEGPGHPPRPKPTSMGAPRAAALRSSSLGKGGFSNTKPQPHKRTVLDLIHLIQAEARVLRKPLVSSHTRDTRGSGTERSSATHGGRWWSLCWIRVLQIVRNEMLCFVATHSLDALKVDPSADGRASYVQIFGWCCYARGLEAVAGPVRAAFAGRQGNVHFAAVDTIDRAICVFCSCRHVSASE